MKTTLFLFLASVCIAFGEREIKMQPVPENYRIAHYEPVLAFELNDAKDEISFSAYGETWRFSVWLSDVKEANEHHFYARSKERCSDKLSGFTVAPEYITGMIVLSNDTLWLEARDPKKPNELVVYRQSQISAHRDLMPILASMPVPEDVAQEAQKARNLAEKRIITAYGLRIYYDQDWIVGPFGWWPAMVGLVHDTNIALFNVGLHGFAVEANYAAGVYNPHTDPYQMLLMIGNVANVQPGFTNYAYMVGRNIGGIAWVGTTCNPAFPSFYKTSVNGLVSWSRLFTVKTLAHETAHNRGANHDFVNQCDVNNVPGCQCSIMSYCSPQPGYYAPVAAYYSATSVYEMAVAGCF